MRKLFIILIVTIAAISCGKIKDAHKILNDIETFINERPDSALTILDSFDTSLLQNKSVWAHQSLLHAQAKDKCYIDETDDSLMTQVVNYYEGKRDKEKLFKAYYYLGRIQYNAGLYAESMLSYTKAEMIVYDIEDNFYKGLLYAQLGRIHYKYYDYTRSVESYENALIYYERAGKLNHKYYTKLDIGQIYQEERMYHEAEKLFKEIIVWAYDNMDYWLCEVAVGNLITLYDEIGKFEKSIELMKSKYGNVNLHSAYILRTQGIEAAIRGDENLSYLYQHRIWGAAKSIIDTLNNYYYEYSIAKFQRKYAEALVAHENIQIIQDSILSNAIKYPLLSIKNSYLKSEYDNMCLKIREHTIVIIAIIIIVVVLGALFTSIIKHRITLKNITIARYIEMAEDLEITIKHKQEEITSISKNAGIISQKLYDSGEFISKMLSKQYELLNKLTSTYYETHGCSKDKEAIYRYVSKEIERLSSDKETIHQLEDLVNSYKGNIMITIREELPHLTEMEYRLLCYLCVGFSAKAISIFTGDSTNNIYVKKSRIKHEILKLNSDSRTKILIAINSHES